MPRLNPLPKAKPKPKPEPCLVDDNTAQDLENIAFEGPTIALKRWKEYEIMVSVENVKSRESITKTFQYNTFR